MKNEHIRNTDQKKDRKDYMADNMLLNYVWICYRSD